MRASLETPAAGVVTLWLLMNATAWVHRRVETCILLDRAYTKRRVSLDFTLPQKVRY